jgi:hypothetical protein
LQYCKPDPGPLHYNEKSLHFGFESGNSTKEVESHKVGVGL